MVFERYVNSSIKNEKTSVLQLFERRFEYAKAELFTHIKDWNEEKFSYSPLCLKCVSKKFSKIGINIIISIDTKDIEL